MTKILIVEDEPGIYTFLKEGLIDEGYDTLVATDGSEALRDFADWKPDLVLLDWMLPTMDGIEVCRSIRETDVTTPVLFLTAKDGVEDTIKGLRTGANDYIKKPFSFDELLERIKIHFRNRQHDELLRLPIRHGSHRRVHECSSQKAWHECRRLYQDYPWRRLH